MEANRWEPLGGSSLNNTMYTGNTTSGGLRISRWGSALALLWTGVVLVSYFWNAHQTRSLLLAQAQTELRANFFKDVTFRRWATRHGGVYVPVTEQQQPDPYISHLPERDVVTPSGRMLTLINPALMMRQLNELAREQYGAEGHISSRRPLNPNNLPDAWESNAYEQLQLGAEEVSGISELHGAPYLRLIRPMQMESECLKCHGQQGFKEGDFGGGVSVSVALAPIETLFLEERSVLIGAHLILWLLGIGGIVLGNGLLAARVTERERAYKALAENEQRTRAIVASSLDAIITIDAAGKITGWSEQAETMFGWKCSEVLGRPLSATIIPERYREAHEHGVRRAVKKNGGGMLNHRVEITALCRDGTEIPIELSIAAIVIDGRPAFSAFLHDISKRKHNEAKRERDVIVQRTMAKILEISMRVAPFRERLSMILQETLSVPWLRLQAKGAIFVIGKEGPVLEMVAHHGMSEAVQALCSQVRFGECLCGKVAEQKQMIHKSCIDHEHDKQLRSMQDHGHYCLPIISGERLLGVFNLYLDHGHMRDEEEVQLLSAISNAIGGLLERNEMEQQLRHNAYHDELTGLPNRSLLHDLLEHCMARLARQENYRFAVLFLDLDRFKVINDSLGHSVGDRLLVAVAARLRAINRAQDTVARLGGDEFVLLLDDVPDETAVACIAERIHEEMRMPFVLDGQEVFSPCSIGIAISDKRYRQPSEMLRDADTAMYRAKQHGGARSVQFGEKMHAVAIARLTIEGELRRALEAGDLRIHYQPIYSVENGRIEGVEALVRWPVEDENTISPEEFIPVAEETGLISELGLWALREACRQVGIWQRSVEGCDGLYVSVNLSGRQLMQGDLLEQIDTVLAGLEFNPALLRLEITESVLMTNPEASSHLITQLRQRGIRFYIDDFGTGYSSLSYLHSFPFDALKIDRSFVARLGSGVEHVRLVETIVAIAHNFGMKVIAEGVEQQEQHNVLSTLGCDYLQGYLLAKPLSAPEAERLLSHEEPLATV